MFCFVLFFTEKNDIISFALIWFLLCYDGPCCAVAFVKLRFCFFYSFNKTNSLHPITYRCVHNIHIQVGLKQERVENKCIRQPFLLSIQRESDQESDKSGNEVNRHKSSRVSRAERALSSCAILNRVGGLYGRILTEVNIDFSQSNSRIW